MYADAKLYRVVSGLKSRWFTGEQDARDYARDRFDYEFDGVPWVQELSFTEALTRLNDLEAASGG